MCFHPFDHVGRIECAIGLNDGVNVISHDLRRNAAGGLFAGFCIEGEDEKHKEGDSEECSCQRFIHGTPPLMRML